jgi:hypothetical protein
VGITERSTYGIVTDLTAAGYTVKQKDGRRNRYQIQAHMPLPEPTSQQLAIGEVLALLAGASTGGQLTGGNPADATTASRTAEAASPRSLTRKMEISWVCLANGVSGGLVSRSRRPGTGRRR